MTMTGQELEAAVSLLLDEMEGDQGDHHEIFLRLTQILNTMRATGMSLPADLLKLERQMMADIESEKPR